MDITPLLPTCGSAIIACSMTGTERILACRLQRKKKLKERRGYDDVNGEEMRFPPSHSSEKE
jgi:hypothetical protein